MRLATILAACLLTGLLPFLVEGCSRSAQPFIARVCGNPAPAADIADNGGPPARGSGILVVPQGDDLYSMQADGTSQRQLTHEANGAFANSPAFSPDGQLLAYAHHVPASGSSWGSAELHVMKIDGSADRVLVQAAGKGERAEEPSWSPDGTAIYYAHDVPVVDQSGRYAGDNLTIERVSLDGRPPEVVQTDAIEPSISASGTLAWVNYNPADQTFKLQVRAAGDESTRTLLTSKDFQAIWTPAISPDGNTIAFSGSGRSDTKVRVAGYGLAVVLSPRVEAHGLPWDPWVIHVDGSGLKRLAALGSDEQSLTWSPDAQLIACSNLTATYLMRGDGGGLGQLLKRGDPGGIAWTS